MMIIFISIRYTQLLVSVVLHSGYAARDTVSDHKKKSMDDAIKDAAVFFQLHRTCLLHVALVCIYSSGE